MRDDITFRKCKLVRSSKALKLLHVRGHPLHVLNLLHLDLGICNCHELPSATTYGLGWLPHGVT